MAPGSSEHGILQARILEWVAILFSRGSFRPTNETQVCIAGRLSSEPPEKLPPFIAKMRQSKTPPSKQAQDLLAPGQFPDEVLQTQGHLSSHAFICFTVKMWSRFICKFFSDFHQCSGVQESRLQVFQSCPPFYP